jgi:hypothetical protein
MSRYRRSAALFVAGALAATPALAQQGEPIGSWWLLDMSGEAAPRHAIMTMSTQGSGVVAFQCAGARSTVLLGMNKPEFRPEAGATVALAYQIGGGTRHQAQAALTFAETLEFDEAVSGTIIAEAAQASSFSFHLPQAATEVTLVFRPVATDDAVARMRAACAKPLPAR